MNFDSDTNVIEVAVRRLRAKIDDGFEPKLIQTVRGMGYVLETPETRLMRRPSLTLRLTLLFAVRVDGGAGGAGLPRGHVGAGALRARSTATSCSARWSSCATSSPRSARPAEFAAMPGRDGRCAHRPPPPRRCGSPDPTAALLYATAAVALSRPSDFPLRLTEGRPASPAIATWRHGDHSFRGTMASVATRYPGTPQVIVAVADQHRPPRRLLRRVHAQPLDLDRARARCSRRPSGWVAARRGLAPDARDGGRRADASARAACTTGCASRRCRPELIDLAVAFNGMLARLEDSFRRLSDFSSDLAHEFRRRSAT